VKIIEDCIPFHDYLNAMMKKMLIW